MDENHEKIDTSKAGNEANPARTVPESKGKGKAVDISPHDVSMGDEDSSDEETGAEDEEVRPDSIVPSAVLHANASS